MVARIIIFVYKNRNNSNKTSLTHHNLSKVLFRRKHLNLSKQSTLNIIKWQDSYFLSRYHIVMTKFLVEANFENVPSPKTIFSAKTMFSLAIHYNTWQVISYIASCFVCLTNNKYSSMVRKESCLQVLYVFLRTNWYSVSNHSTVRDQCWD